MNINGYQRYKQQSVDTMTNGEVLILLFDAAIRNLTSASMALEKKDIDTFHESLEKTAKIIRHLSDSLDMSYPISKDLYRLYDYFSYQIGRLRAGRRKEVADELKEMLFDLRNTFKEADRLASNKKKNT